MARRVYAIRKTAQKKNLFIDNNLRGSINYIVESDKDLSWSSIGKIEYANVKKDIDLSSFPKSVREDNIVIYHANTPELSVQGLQNVEDGDFPDNSVMVFYKTAGASFHMQNVKFPLELIWTDADFNVVAVNKMDKNPYVRYRSPINATHAVEARLGFCKRYAIDKGKNIKEFVK